MKINKKLILGVIIAIAMIVLVSGEVAGYNAGEKNESEEELADLTISIDRLHSPQIDEKKRNYS